MQIDKDVLKVLNESDEYSSLEDLWQDLLTALESRLSNVAIKGLKLSKALRVDEIKLPVFKSVNPYVHINGTVYRPIKIKLINNGSDIAVFWSTETQAFTILSNTEQVIDELIAKIIDKLRDKAQQEKIDLSKPYEIDKTYIQYTNYSDTQDATYIAAWALELLV